MIFGGCAPGWFPAWIFVTLYDKFFGEAEADVLLTKATQETKYVIFLPLINFNFCMFSFEFLAGNLEEDYPQQTRAACRVAAAAGTKYQV